MAHGTFGAHGERVLQPVATATHSAQGLVTTHYHQTAALIAQGQRAKQQPVDWMNVLV